MITRETLRHPRFMPKFAQKVLNQGFGWLKWPNGWYRIWKVLLIGFFSYGLLLAIFDGGSIAADEGHWCLTSPNRDIWGAIHCVDLRQLLLAPIFFALGPILILMSLLVCGWIADGFTDQDKN